jgi:acyl-coenzyme A synthetase/AMP-(fatty) acid ligase
MYGLTESFRSTYLPFSEAFTRPGSIGKPVPEVEILVLNERGERCAPGERGELVHRGAFVTYGYLHNPELNARKFIPLQTGGAGCLPEMAVRSGDVVSRDEDGYLYFHGRVDLQMKCNGYRVSPDEVESAVLLVPGISHAAVFGRPDPEVGEAIALAYATYAGTPVEEPALRRHLAQALPSYAVPRSIHFYKSLPLTPHGKIDYPALRRAAEEPAPRARDLRQPVA